MLSAWISAAFSFLSPYYFRDRASNYSEVFVKSFPVCIDGQVVVGEQYFCGVYARCPKAKQTGGASQLVDFRVDMETRV